MGFLKSIFRKNEEPIHSYEDFWTWFEKYAQTFYKVVKTEGKIDKDFFNKLHPKLNEIKDGLWYMTGMYDNDTVELVITADGSIENIVFVEELIRAAPNIEGWKFTALKPALDIKDVNIEMSGYEFNKDNLNFYANQDTDYPDEIDITLVHSDLNEKSKSAITNGVYIFLDNYLGELDFAVSIDSLKVIGSEEAEKELISIEKLKDYLKWRQMEFIEKYEEFRRDTENDPHSILEGKLENGLPLVAVINTDLLQWDGKASHPWILSVRIPYDGKHNNGMPEKRDFNLIEEIEEKISTQLKDFEGFLNIGRQTVNNQREIYYACKDFRKPAKLLHDIKKTYSTKVKLTYEIYKDKYWMSFDRFNPVH